MYFTLEKSVRVGNPGRKSFGAGVGVNLILATSGLSAIALLGLSVLSYFAILIIIRNYKRLKTNQTIPEIGNKRKKLGQKTGLKIEIRTRRRYIAPQEI